MPLPTATEAATLLGVAADASNHEIKRAWRILALRHHPDKNPDNPDAARLFREAADAYKVLANADIEIKSYEQLAADNDDARTALQRAMDIASRRAAAPAEVSDAKEKVMKVGAATWVGEVEAGRPHGTGDLILPNGAVHHGYFEAGRASGEGTLYEATGSVLRGSWTENKKVGDFITRFKVTNTDFCIDR